MCYDWSAEYPFLLAALNLPSLYAHSQLTFIYYLYNILLILLSNVYICSSKEACVARGRHVKAMLETLAKLTQELVQTFQHTIQWSSSVE